LEKILIKVDKAKGAEILKFPIQSKMELNTKNYPAVRTAYDTLKTMSQDANKVSVTNLNVEVMTGLGTLSKCREVWLGSDPLRPTIPSPKKQEAFQVHQQWPGGLPCQQDPGLQAEGDPPQDEGEDWIQG